MLCVNWPSRVTIILNTVIVFDKPVHKRVKRLQIKFNTVKKSNFNLSFIHLIFINLTGFY